MKIAYFGTGNFSKNILYSLLQMQDIKILLSVSQPDKKVGRKQIIEETPIKLISKENGIKISQPTKLKENNDFFDELKLLELDFIVVVAYGRIIPKEVLNIPKYGVINIHGSILPKYRGASPVQESLKNGDTETGLTIMKMSEGMDEGDIYSIEKVNIDINDKAPDIFKKFESIGPELLRKTLLLIQKGEIIATSQNNNIATYCTKIEKKNGKVYFKKETSKEIYDKFRAYYEWPGIYSYYNGKKISFEDCFFNENYSSSDKEFGTVIKLENNEIGIICLNGIFLVKKVKLEGKKEIDIKDFLNGNKNFLNYTFE